MLKILKYYKRLRLFVLSRTNSYKYAKEIGVNLKGKAYFYGISSGCFGSEPWLITLGNNVHITGDCQFLTHDGSTLILRKDIPDLELTAPIEIGNDVFIGFRTIILPGVKIGNRCIIGAGSVVNKSIPDNSVAVGNPCRVVKSIDDYLEKIKPLSLEIGHLNGDKKAMELKKIFNVKHI
jgi:acetyltransferase-like isoleucine patch superfamily enzyme